MIAIAVMVDKVMNSRIDGGGILVGHALQSFGDARSCKTSGHIRVCLRRGFNSPGRVFAGIGHGFPVRGSNQPMHYLIRIIVAARKFVALPLQQSWRSAPRSVAYRMEAPSTPE